ncbi:MAG TPA: condensation domain-containing protein [Gaiellaceae bacterium]
MTLPAQSPSRTAAPVSGWPASEQQRYFWFLQQLSPDQPLVNVLATLRVPFALDAEEVRGALRAVAERHSTLRSQLVAQGDELLQVSLDADAIPFESIAVRDVEEARQRARAEGHHVFDVAREAPTRCFLYRAESGETVVALVCQHAAVDRYAVELVVRDLVASLEEELAEPAADALEYQDYARWQRAEHEAGTNVEWWADRLAAVELDPTDPAARPVQHAEVDVSELVGRARAAASTFGLMLGTVLLGGLVDEVGGDRDLLVGLVVANRLREEFAEVVGPFARLVPLPVRSSPTESLEQLSRRLHADLGAALARQEVPIDRLGDELRRRGAAFQFPSIVFNLVSAKSVAPTLRGQSVDFDVEEIGEEAAHADLVVVVWPGEAWRAAIDVREGGRYAGYTPAELVRAWTSRYPPPAQ